MVLCSTSGPSEDYKRGLLGWKWLEMAGVPGNWWRWLNLLEMDKNGFKWLECHEITANDWTRIDIARKDEYCLIYLEICWKLLEIARNCLTCLEWLDLAKHGWKWLKLDGPTIISGIWEVWDMKIRELAGKGRNMLYYAGMDLKRLT